MIDALWIAASGLDYASSVMRLERPDEYVIEFTIAPHPCDDEPYVANVDIVGAGWCTTAQFDGCQYLGCWELVDGQAVYEPCQKCGQSIEAPVHNVGMAWR